MNFIGNLIWLIFGGIFIAIEYLLAGVLFCISIIGIPFGIQCFKLAALSLWPFGKNIVTQPNSGGCLYVLLNVLWFCTAGIAIAFTHLFFALILAITIIGIPWAKQHIKLIELSLFPFGKEIR